MTLPLRARLAASYTALVALLRDRRLKPRARSVLVGYGPPVIDALAHFMRDKDFVPEMGRNFKVVYALKF